MYTNLHSLLLTRKRRNLRGLAFSDPIDDATGDEQSKINSDLDQRLSMGDGQSNLSP